MQQSLFSVSLAEVFLTPLLRSQIDVLDQGLAVEPGFIAVYVTHVEETLVGCILRTAVATDNKDMVRW